MSSPFESYDDLEDAGERLSAADPAERRVAIIALGHSGDPAAVGHLRGLVTDPDAGAGDMASVPHNYMLGAFTNGSVAGMPTSRCCRISDG